jgi:hypothetical protein
MKFSNIRTLALLIAKISLLAIALFTIGPLLGSLDADSDGYPEVPIVVLNPSNAANFLYSQNENQRTSIIVVALSLFPAVLEKLQQIETEFVNLPGSMLCSLVPLRC